MSERWSEDLAQATDNFWCRLLVEVDKQVEVRQTDAYKSLLARVAGMSIDTERWPELANLSTTDSSLT